MRLLLVDSYLLPLYYQLLTDYYTRTEKKPVQLLYRLWFLAGAVGLEPTTNGFGDRYSTN